MVRSHMREGESLISALARLQGEGRRLLFQPGRPPEWTEEQRQILAALFGSEIMDRLSMGSAEIDQLLRRELLEKLSTESASELVSKSRMAELLGPIESSLFSAYAAGGLGAAFSSEVTSWTTGLGASWSAQPFGQGRGNFSCTSTPRSFSTAALIPTRKSGSTASQMQLLARRHFPLPFPFPGRQLRHPHRRRISRRRRAALRLASFRARHRAYRAKSPHRPARASADGAHGPEVAVPPSGIGNPKLEIRSYAGFSDRTDCGQPTSRPRSGSNSSNFEFRISNFSPILMELCAPTARLRSAAPLLPRFPRVRAPRLPAHPSQLPARAELPSASRQSPRPGKNAPRTTFAVSYSS